MVLLLVMCEVHTSCTVWSTQALLTTTGLNGLPRGWQVQWQAPVATVARLVAPAPEQLGALQAPAGTLHSPGLRAPRAQAAAGAAGPSARGPAAQPADPEAPADVQSASLETGVTPAADCPAAVGSWRMLAVHEPPVPLGATCGEVGLAAGASYSVPCVGLEPAALAAPANMPGVRVEAEAMPMAGLEADQGVAAQASGSGVPRACEEAAAVLSLAAVRQELAAARLVLSPPSLAMHVWCVSCGLRSLLNPIANLKKAHESSNMLCIFHCLVSTHPRKQIVWCRTLLLSIHR